MYYTVLYCISVLIRGVLFGWRAASGGGGSAFTIFSDDDQAGARTSPSPGPAFTIFEDELSSLSIAQDGHHSVQGHLGAGDMSRITEVSETLSPSISFNSSLQGHNSASAAAGVSTGSTGSGSSRRRVVGLGVPLPGLSYENEAKNERH